MGVMFGGKISSSSVDSYVPITPPNPDPRNFKILSDTTRGRYLLIKIKYPDCTNYEGVKLLIFKDVTLKELQKQKAIDPHFSNSKKYHSPVARFEPTKQGEKMAKRLMATMENLGE